MSGVKVYGDQRAAALCDYDNDGRVDLAVSQNGAATKLYRNIQAKPGLRVRLVGPGRNGNGFGSVIRIGRPGAWGAAREVHAGSGYWSQDSSVQVLSAKGDPATHIHIRWPGGKTTVAPLPPQAHEIQINYEGALSLLK